MKTLKNHMFFLCFVHLEVPERALGVIGGSCGEPWGPWGVPRRFLRVRWGSLGALGGSLGVLGAPIRGNFETNYVFKHFQGAWGSFGASSGIVGGVGAPLEVLGGA